MYLELAPATQSLAEYVAYRARSTGGQATV